MTEEEKQKLEICQNCGQESLYRNKEGTKESCSICHYQLDTMVVTPEEANKSILDDFRNLMDSKKLKQGAGEILLPEPIDDTKKIVEKTYNIKEVKPGDIVVVQGIKDAYEGVVVSVQDDTIRMRTPSWATMQWNKSSIKEITPRIARDEYEPPPKRKGGRKGRGTAAGGYLK